jgi:hypothetical protein
MVKLMLLPSAAPGAPRRSKIFRKSLVEHDHARMPQRSKMIISEAAEVVELDEAMTPYVAI